MLLNQINYYWSSYRYFRRRFSKIFGKRMRNSTLLGHFRRAKRLREGIFKAFNELKNQNFGSRDATSGIYLVCYKPSVLSYPKAKTYVRVFRDSMSWSIIQNYCKLWTIWKKLWKNHFYRGYDFFKITPADC